MANLSIAEIRKTEIIEALLKVVSGKGLAKATVREVADTAGCSHGMVRHYFGDKETMILEALDHMIEVYTKDFQTGASKDDSAMDRLKYLISWWVDLRGVDTEWNQMMREFRVFAKSNEAVSGAIQKYYGLASDAIADIIRDGIKLQEFRKVNPAHTAKIICSTLDGIVGFWLVDPKEMPLQLMAEQAEELFQKYLAQDKYSDATTRETTP